jgi:hypothetical protein
MAIRDHRCFCQHRSCRSPHMRKCSSLVNSPSYKPVIPKGYNSMAIRYRENDDKLGKNNDTIVDRIEWATRFFRHTQFYTHIYIYVCISCVYVYKLYIYIYIYVYKYTRHIPKGSLGIPRSHFVKHLIWS